MAEVANLPTSFTSPDSASVEGASYDPVTQILTVTLRPGKTYTYDRVPAATWRRFVEAESKGKFFQGSIRPVFLGRRA